jgi:hypothetical protein
MKRKTMSMVTHFVELVVKIMPLMSFGSVVICVRNGSMANVLRLLLQELNTLSIINVHLAATKGPEFNGWPRGPSTFYST